MTKYLPAFIAALLFSGQLSAQVNTQKSYSFAQSQTEVMLKSVEQAKVTATKPNLVVPRTLDTAGNLVLINSRDWCSGFFAGELWQLYEFNRNSKANHWLEEAKKYTALVEQEQYDKSTHDLGFKIYCSVGQAYRLTGDEHYKQIIIQAAKTLCTRFNPQVGCIKSWDHQKSWQFPVIIDNMMNLELLFEATKLSCDSSFYKIAVTHANTTMKNHYRADNSSYHVVDYDPQTGAVLHRQTAQGYADESAWARGQAWGLYGYTMCYRETHNPVYLRQAEKIAAFILNNTNLPKDGVPYWDFNAPDIPNAPRDASAAAIMASAFYELCLYSKQGKQYAKAADLIINSLSSHYQAQPGGSKGFLLLHSVGHKPAGSEIDVPIIYADYYYLEALSRQQKIYNTTHFSKHNHE